MTISEGGAYTLKFVPQALDEWSRLDGSVKEEMRKALKKRLSNPHVPASRLHGDLAGCYKIKLQKAGLRLVYQVDDGVLVVLVLAVAKREDLKVYRQALTRYIR